MGTNRKPPKRSPRVQAMENALRRMERAVRSEALKLATAGPMRATDRAALIAQQARMTRQVQGARAVIQAEKRKAKRKGGR